MHIYDQSIVTFGINGLCLGFSKTSHVDVLDKFIKTVVYKVKFDISIVFKEKNYKEDNMKIQNTN